MILKTFLPLMVSRSVQRVSRPLINLFMARDRRDGITQADSLEVSFRCVFKWFYLSFSVTVS